MATKIQQVIMAEDRRNKVLAASAKSQSILFRLIESGISRITLPLPMLRSLSQEIFPESEPVDP